jgi:hypothetical protein
MYQIPTLSQTILLKKALELPIAMATSKVVLFDLLGLV